jgi:hypothetical protein
MRNKDLLENQIKDKNKELEENQKQQEQLEKELEINRQTILEGLDIFKLKEKKPLKEK